MARLEELKNSAPSDDIFDQLPDRIPVRKPKVHDDDLPDRIPVNTKFVDEEDDQETLEDVSEDFIPFKRQVKRVKLRQEEHGTTKFRIMSKTDQKYTCHVADSLLNLRAAKTSGHLSKVKRESAQSRSHRLTKMQLSGKNVRCTEAK